MKQDIRLYTVAKEFNVSTFTLVDFLEKKGVHVVNNPNTKLTIDQYSMIKESFVKDNTNKFTVDIGQRKYENLKVDGSSERLPFKSNISKTWDNLNSKKKTDAHVNDDDVIVCDVSRGGNSVQNSGKENNNNDVIGSKEQPFGLKVVSHFDVSQYINSRNKPSRKTGVLSGGVGNNVNSETIKSGVNVSIKAGQTKNKSNDEQKKNQYSGFNNFRRSANKKYIKRTGSKKFVKIKRVERKDETKVIEISDAITVCDFANILELPVGDVIKCCDDMGVVASANQILTKDTIEILAEEFGVNLKINSLDDDLIFSNDSELTHRIPIVTVMGHVDHGKTSLLDYIRKSNITKGESGGITQHLGAYKIKTTSGKDVVFLDTPGHEAFVAMRNRGARVTDVVVMVIAADDGVKQQTKEALSQAQMSGAPIIFAINKIDKEGANPDKIKETLASMNFLVEDWGGKYQCQNISAKTGEGVEDLLSKILLEAEMLDLKSHSTGPASGVVLESSKDQFKGFINNCLVLDGRLDVGDVVVAGTCWGKVKSMFDDNDRNVKEAVNVSVVKVLGLNGAVIAGGRFVVVEKEKRAKEIVDGRVQILKEQNAQNVNRLKMKELERRMALENYEEINIIVKADVYGSAQALADSLVKLSTDNVLIKIVKNDVGIITDSDVQFAVTTRSIIIAFNVKTLPSSVKLARQNNVDIRSYSIIYDALDDVSSMVDNMFKSKFTEEYVGKAEVKAIFNISKVGLIAGCIVLEGPIQSTNTVKVIRGNEKIFEGKIKDLKHFKTSVKEVKADTECGISLEKYNDFNVGDIIECYKVTCKV